MADIHLKPGEVAHLTEGDRLVFDHTGDEPWPTKADYQKVLEERANQARRIANLRAEIGHLRRQIDEGNHVPPDTIRLQRQLDGARSGNARIRHEGMEAAKQRDLYAGALLEIAKSKGGSGIPARNIARRALEWEGYAPNPAEVAQRTLDALDALHRAEHNQPNTTGGGDE